MFKRILLIFFTWRISLFVVAALAVVVFPQFGSRFPYADQVLKVTGLPNWIWGFGNFDGVHYLRIAQNGYDAEFTQAFFPLYPLLIRILNLLPKNPLLDTRIYVDPSFFWVGFILANIFFLLSLYLFYKLIRIDFNQKVAFRSLILLAFFPTSFYFGAIYTESLFLFLVLGALYFTRKGNFLAAGIFSALASATRVFGLLLIPVILIEFFLRFRGRLFQRSGDLAQMIIGVLIAPFGLLFYMLYLRFNFDQPLYFLTSQPLFGAERTSSSVVFLPQVIYRYLKIFLTVPITSQLFLNAFLEFTVTVVLLTSLILFIKKIRFSYLIFTLGCLALPTLTGTLSSMPRYALMGFLLLPFLSQFRNRYFRILVFTSILTEIILTAIYIRGYWVA